MSECRWFWYFEQPDEITVDLDRVSGRQLEAVQQRIEGSGLAIDSVWLFPSGADWRHHLIVRLLHDMDVRKRIAWSLVFGNDPRRAARSLLRMGTRTIESLLIAPEPWNTRYGFYRPRDEECECAAAVHKSSMHDCPVGRLYRPRDEIVVGALDSQWRSFGKVL